MRSGAGPGAASVVFAWVSHLGVQALAQCGLACQEVEHGPPSAPQGVDEDGQLGLDNEGRDDVASPKVVEALLGLPLRSGGAAGGAPLVAGSRNTLAIDARGQVSADAAMDALSSRLGGWEWLGDVWAAAPGGDAQPPAGLQCAPTPASWRATTMSSQVWAWGWNDRGTLGQGHRLRTPKPQRVAALGHVRVAQAAVSGWHALAVTDAGQVMRDSARRLISLHAVCTRGTPAPAAPPLAAAWRLRSQVFCWGGNEYQQVR